MNKDIVNSLWTKGKLERVWKTLSDKDKFNLMFAMYLKSKDL